MKITNGYENFNNSNKGTVVTTGTFDGIHLGHQKIISQLVESSKKQNLESLVFSFHPHPRLVLFPDSELKLLNTQKEKAEILQNLGVDHLVIHPFTKEFSRLSSLNFIRDVLVNKLNMQKLIIGYDHQFGKNREGNFDQLKEYSNVYQFEIEEVTALQSGEINVSSTKIRNAILEGEMNKANQYLGHSYKLAGLVVEGDKIGRKIGFPTANIQIEDRWKLIPPNGVYAVKVGLSNSIHFGMLNIGNRPTINSSNKRTIEVNIFDFDEEIYGLEIELEILDRIREEKRFDSVDALKAQISQDESVIKSKLFE